MLRTPAVSHAPRLPWILLAVASGVGTAIVYSLAVTSESGQRWEDTALLAANYPGDWFGMLNLVSIPTIIIVTLIALVVATIRRRPDLIARVLVIVGGATLTGQLLKNAVLDRPELATTVAQGDVLENSFPSGHTIVVLALWIALGTVLPPLGRRLIVLVATPYSAVVSIQLVDYGWHRVSDIIGGALIVITMTALATALWPDRRTERVVRPADRVVRGFVIVALVASAAAAVGLFMTYRIAATSQPEILLLAAQAVAVGGILVTFLVTLIPWKTPRQRERASTEQGVEDASFDHSRFGLAGQDADRFGTGG